MGSAVTLLWCVCVAFVFVCIFRSARRTLEESMTRKKLAVQSEDTIESLKDRSVVCVRAFGRGVGRVDALRAYFRLELAWYVLAPWGAVLFLLTCNFSLRCSRFFAVCSRALLVLFVLFLVSRKPHRQLHLFILRSCICCAPSSLIMPVMYANTNNNTRKTTRGAKTRKRKERRKMKMKTRKQRNEVTHIHHVLAPTLVRILNRNRLRPHALPRAV